MKNTPENFATAHPPTVVKPIWPEFCKWVTILEDISHFGANLQLEEAVPIGAAIYVRVSGQEFRGTVRPCNLDETLGYFVGIEFASGTRWTPLEYTPSHLLNPSSLEDTDDVEESEPEKSCAWRVCPRELVARVVDREISLSRKVREVAAEVAHICGDMDEKGLDYCFSWLFESEAGCALFQDFASSYQAVRVQPSLLQNSSRKQN